MLDFNEDGKSDVIINDAVYDKKSDWWNDLFGSPWGEFSKHYVYWLQFEENDFKLYKKIKYNKEDALSQYFVTGDFEGTGRQELMFYGFNAIATNPTDNDKKVQWRKYHNNGFDHQSGKITRITDGMGNKNQFEYVPLTDNSVYTKQKNATFPVIDIQAPLYVIKQMTANAGSVAENKTGYIYKGAKVHTQGRGFLGFNEVTASNSLLDRKTNTKYDYNKSYYYPFVTEQKITTISGTALSTTNYGNECLSFGNKRIFSYVASQTLKDELTTLSTKTETSNLDDYGNPGTIKATQGGLTETQTLKYIQKGSWCPNKPEKVTVEKLYETDKYTRITAFEYDAKGNLTKETMDPGDANQVITEYKDYNIHGNPQKIITTADVKGISISRSQTLTYTPSGRFVQTRTNDQFNETTTYQYNESKGLLQNETNRLGVTSYQYDNWGRLTFTYYPDGTKTAHALWWAGTNPDKPAGAIVTAGTIACFNCYGEKCKYRNKRSGNRYQIWNSNNYLQLPTFGFA